MRTEDGHIVQECLNGEPGAFGMIVDKYKEGIYAFAYDKLRDFQDAQDVTQEVFLQAYRGLRTLRRWESLAFWLYRIAYARCIDLLRIRSRRVDQDFIEDQDPEVIDAPSLDSYRRDQRSQSIREALDSLPDAYREVLVLHYFGGMTIKDMARALGASPAAIGKRLSRGRARLKEEMITMMETAFEEQRLATGFTFRIVEAVKRIKINPMPRTAGIPLGLSLAMGIIITVLSLNPQISIVSDMAIPTGSPLPVKAKVLKTGEIPVDILDVSQMLVISDKQGDSDGEEPQNAVMLAPQQDRAGKWAQKADMPTGRAALSTCAVNGKIYAVGGTDPWGDKGVGARISALEEYDPAIDIWTKKANMPTARSSLSTSVVDGKIYAIGGYNGVQTFSTVEMYDPATDTWTRKADMPTKRAWLSCSVVDGKIYAIGGATGVIKKTVEEYDPETDTWAKKADMPTARSTLSTSVVDGKIYAVGGYNGFQSLPTVEVYDPATDKWTKKADMPTTRGFLSTSVCNGEVYAIGGTGGIPGVWYGNPLSTVEKYNPATDIWTAENAMPKTRVALSTSVLNGKIYAIGGNVASFGPNLSTVEEYTPEGWEPSQNLSISQQGKLPTTWGEVKSD